MKRHKLVHLDQLLHSITPNDYVCSRQSLLWPSGTAKEQLMAPFLSPIDDFSLIRGSLTGWDELDKDVLLSSEQVQLCSTGTENRHSATVDARAVVGTDFLGSADGRRNHDLGTALALGCESALDFPRLFLLWNCYPKTLYPTGKSQGFPSCQWSCQRCALALVFYCVWLKICCSLTCMMVTLTTAFNILGEFPGNI